MPNWVATEVTFKGNDEDIKKVLEKYQVGIVNLTLIN